MKQFKKILKATQKQLFEMLCRKFNNAVSSEGDFILVEGAAPVMLVAHLDTVHAEPVKEICISADGNILMSPQGIGGDDRCGVYALIKSYERAVKKPYLLFTCDEETGGVGAEIFALEYRAGNLPNLDGLKCLIEIDRKGANDAVYYNCNNPEFEDYIGSKGFTTARGSFSDISVIAPELGIAAVNLSSGYYNPHTLHEYINRQDLNRTISKVAEIISDAAQVDFPKYEYGQNFQFNYNLFGDEELEELPPNLPKEYEEVYEELLYCHSKQELEGLRKYYGNGILNELYHLEFEGYSKDDKDEPEPEF